MLLQSVCVCCASCAQLRTLKRSNSLMVLMESIGEAIMPTTSVLIKIFILLYIFAILFTESIAQSLHFEDDEYGPRNARYRRELSRSLLGSTLDSPRGSLRADEQRDKEQPCSSGRCTWFSSCWRRS